MVARIWNSYLQNKPIFTIMTKVQYVLQLKINFKIEDMEKILLFMYGIMFIYSALQC